MDKLGAMTILLKVAEIGSFSAAAKQLDVPLATVSRRVAELEAHLKIRLLNRSSRQLSLTEAGRFYLEEVSHILHQVDKAESAARGFQEHPQGQLVVTAPNAFARAHLVPIISDFLANHSGIDLKLMVANGLETVIDTGVDVALCIGELGDSGLIASRVGVVRRVTCAAPSYLAAHGRPVKPDDLKYHVCITCDNLASTEAWRFLSSAGQPLTQIHSRLTVTAAEAAVEAAIAGMGLTPLLSYQIAEARRAGRLELTLEDHEPSPWPVNLVFREQKLLPKKTRAFLDFVSPRLKRRLLEEIAMLKFGAETLRVS